MIFKKQLVDKIVAGRKTQTRRLPKHPTRARRANGTEYTTRPWKPKVGHREPVQPGRGQPAALHVVITDVRQEPLRDITLQDARAEGFRTRAEFASYWMGLYDRDWPPIEEKPCEKCDAMGEIDGERCPAGCDELGLHYEPAIPDDQTVLERFTRRHGDTTVWVIGFELDRDTPLFLSPAGQPRGDDLGYTIRREDAIDDAEAVPPAYQATLSRKAAERDDKARRDRGEGRDTRSAERAANWRDTRAA